METSFLQTSKLWLEQITGPIAEIIWQGLPWFLLFAFVGLVLAIFICLYMRKTKLLRRENTIWNILAKCSYIAVLVAAPLLMGTVGAIYKMQYAIHNSLDHELLPAITKKMPALNSYLSAQTKTFNNKELYSVKDLIDPLAQSLYYQPQSSGIWEKTKAKIVNQVILQSFAHALTNVLHDELVAQIEFTGEIIKDMSGDYKTGATTPIVDTGIDIVTRFTKDTAQKIDFTDMTKSLPRVLVDALIHAIDGYFRSVYFTFLLFALLIAGLILGEVFIYRWHIRKSALPVKQV